MRLRGILSKGRVLAALMAASVAASLLGPAAAGPLRKLARLVIAPPGEVGMYASTAVAHHVEAAMRDTISQDEARRFQAENTYLHSVVAAMARNLADTRKGIADIRSICKDLYGKSDMPSDLIRARVVGLDSLPYTATRVVSARGSDGTGNGNLVTTRELWTDRPVRLPEKLAAITASALVGRITESDSYTARLQLVTDRSFDIGVQIHRVVGGPKHTRWITVVTKSGPQRVKLTARHLNIMAKAGGTGGPLMVIPHIHKHHEVRPGDVVLTRSDDAAVGAPIPVGRVERMDDDDEQPALFATLLVRPYANLGLLREVYIIVPPKRPGANGDGR